MFSLKERNYILLIMGFFVCGFHVTFIALHLPADLMFKGISAEVAGWSLAIIGVTNIIGTLSFGWLGTKVKKPIPLASIYLMRSLTITIFVLSPPSATVAILFGAVIGILWLATVPMTNAIILAFIGPKYLATLSGICFICHQLGAVLGAWLGGKFFDIYGSYENMCLIKGLIDYIENQNKSMMVNSEDTLQKSNFKTMRNIGYDRILVEYSNNEYAFGIKRCKLKNKGKFVCLANKWWMNNTKSIVSNHYIWSDGKFMVIKKTKPIKYIFEVHGFLANTFNTKLYDLYKNGARKIITSNTVIPDDLNEFSKLDTPIINIINKVSGKSIQLETLVNDNIINKSSARNITILCHKLYDYTYRLRDKINLTLACAQYEFGIDEDDNIILIDDIHSYNNCVFWENQEECYSKSPPNIFNSNVVYNWLIQNCHDIDKDVPVIPKDIVKEGEQSYFNYISRLYLSENSSKTAILNTPFRSDTWTWTTAKNIYLNYNHDNMVCIVTDNKDSDIIKRTLMLFKSNNIYANIIELSPYRDVIKLISHVKQHDSSFKKMVWVSLSRDINPICGIISANTKHPVINCPVSIDNKFSMQSLLSSIQQYKDSPVMTILDFNNLPGACSKIFSK